MSEDRPPYDGQPVDGRRAVGTNVSMLPDDVERLERLKAHFGLTSTAAAVRLAITVVVRQIENAETEKVPA